MGSAFQESGSYLHLKEETGIRYIKQEAPEPSSILPLHWQHLCLAELPGTLRSITSQAFPGPWIYKLTLSKGLVYPAVQLFVFTTLHRKWHRVI